MKFSTIGISIGVIVVALAGYAAYVAYPIYKAIHQTKDLMAKAIPYEQYMSEGTTGSGVGGANDRRVSILIAGDSTAVGTGSATSAQSTAGRIGADFPQACIENIGVNGLKLQGLFEKFQAMPDTHYDLIVIQIGANDVVGLTALSKVSSELKEVLTFASAHASHVVVITAGDVGLAPVFKFPLSSIYEARTLSVRKIFIDTIAAYPSITYVDLFKYRKDEIFNTDIAKYYAADHFHPSGDGYGVWYKSMRTVIVEALK